VTFLGNQWYLSSFRRVLGEGVLDLGVHGKVKKGERGGGVDV